MSLSPSTRSTVPVPSHIHYESLLQILEQVSLPSLPPSSEAYQQLHAAVIHLRKALRLQKQFEEAWQLSGGHVDYHWSVNQKTDHSR